MLNKFFAKADYIVLKGWDTLFASLLFKMAGHKIFHPFKAFFIQTLSANP